MQRETLRQYMDDLLAVGQFRDYCPNGLQVEGKSEIHRIVTGVTASLSLLEQAIACQADAVLVHHGYFWKGEDPRVIHTKRRRLAVLLAHDINLFAYHLPLDSHPTLGNNAQLAQRMGWQATGRFGEGEMGWLGQPTQTVTAATLQAQITAVLGRQALLVGESTRPVRHLAWCTGAAQGYLQAAIDAGADCYVSGEISEQTVHLAREAGVAYIAAGHHATERYGIQALGTHLAEEFSLAYQFIDLDNPV
ncbi:Nif3-like dinuclear metal center hexameric protein [Parvibium lacunae]|uniref:GTP cyclohydrolase 1 type 2 homolog n=1 Tax=Parvibium lacunae TaxID=1888893 RepID=A0A368L4Q1_9BURK|nr:Nif3-like dinuclear metal center hexameric protein [Parvibium lacunae]RCS58566.1 Nif3-like dinuclear metal center hexameric protein [Parvibium lacunae]